MTSKVELCTETLRDTQTPRPSGAERFRSVCGIWGGTASPFIASRVSVECLTPSSLDLFFHKTKDAKQNIMASMKIPIIDDIFDDSPIRSSLRIPPLQDPSPAPSTKAGRPSPLEPEARVNISNEATELTGRRKALAQAVPLGAREPNDQEPMETQSIQEHPRKKQKVYAHKTITDFVQLPKPQRKVKEDKPRPFRPISVLNELHEPPPSAALFPPITPSASQEEQEDIRSNVRSVKTSKVKEHLPAKETKVKKSSSDANISKRVYLRQRTKWTEEETEQLVKGVAIYGMGRWKDILEHPEFTFQEGRTGMDLKDR